MSNEIIDMWLDSFLDSCNGTPTKNEIIEEIAETKSTITNEHIWELGYDGQEDNPHTENIINLKEYLQILKSMLED